MANEPQYLAIARSYIGTKEIPGPKHSTVIQGWLKKLGAWWQDDETPWCGVFVAACLQQAGLPIPKNYFRAKEWAAYGAEGGLNLGAIVVLERIGGGHVGFLTGLNEDGSKVRLLGGNQNNQVCEAWFDANRIVARRKAIGVSLGMLRNTKAGAMSKTEA